MLQFVDPNTTEQAERAQTLLAFDARGVAERVARFQQQLALRSSACWCAGCRR
jgi:hypothetical protein